jgi:hypothetical protein
MTVAITLQRSKMIATIASALWLGAATAYLWRFSRASSLAAFTLPQWVFLIAVGIMPPLLLLAVIYDDSSRARILLLPTGIVPVMCRHSH